MTVTVLAVLAMRLVGPLDGLTRDGAQQAARRELSRAAYAQARPSPVVRALQWLAARLGDLLDRISGLPGGRPGAALVLVLVALTVAVALVRLGPLRRTTRPGTAVFAGRAPHTAQDHRSAAQAAVAAGQWDRAIRERLRAAVRSLEDDGALDRRPGRTAGEVAREAPLTRPDLAAVVGPATTAFEDVAYGGRPGTAEGYAAVAALDDRVRGRVAA